MMGPDQTAWRPEKRTGDIVSVSNRWGRRTHRRGAGMRVLGGAQISEDVFEGLSRDLHFGDFLRACIGSQRNLCVTHFFGRFDLAR